MPKITKARLFRREKPEFFPRSDIIAVHDQKTNIVHFNSLFDGLGPLEDRALFMDSDGTEPVLHLPKEATPTVQ